MLLTYRYSVLTFGNYDTRCYFNVRSKANIVSLIYHTEPTTKMCKTEKLKSKHGYAKK